jgi:hypothetical protein
MFKRINRAIVIRDGDNPNFRDCRRDIFEQTSLPPE